MIFELNLNLFEAKVTSKFLLDIPLIMTTWFLYSKWLQVNVYLGKEGDIWCSYLSSNYYIDLGHIGTYHLEIPFKLTHDLTNGWHLVSIHLVEWHLGTSGILLKKQKYCFINVGHKGTSGLLMDILLNVTSALPTVNDLFESTSCKMTLGDPWFPLLMDKIITTDIAFQRWPLVDGF